IDSWTSPLGQSIYAFVIITPARLQFIYSINDFSSDRHTAQFNEEQLLRIIDNIGKEKIAAIVSDADGSKKKDYWAKKTLKKCQKIVSFFHKSHCAGAALHEEIINSLVFGGNLKSSVKTRWSTSWDVCGGKTSSDLLLVQLSLYRNFEEPFNEIYLDGINTPINWWTSLELKKNEDCTCFKITFHTQIHSYLVTNAKDELKYLNEEISVETFNRIALSITNGNDLFGQDDNLEDVSHLDDNCDEEVINLDGVNDGHLIITESIDLNSSLLSNNNILSNEIYEENDIDHGDTNFDIDELLDNHNFD
ncbi:1549_t:CDS:2, partial [Entrophospora sp. SA101]